MFRDFGQKQFDVIAQDGLFSHATCQGGGEPVFWKDILDDALKTPESLLFFVEGEKQSGGKQIHS